MIIDLRDYRTTPGNRDRLIERCEREFFPEQERLGARMLGIFRDADADDRFVWLRAMPDMPTRQRVLSAFYIDGDMWRAARGTVNTWIADSDNVLLMRPASPFGPVASPGQASCVAMYSALDDAPPALALDYLREIPTRVAEQGGRLLGVLATDPVANNFPRHPVRSGVHGLVWLASFAPGARWRLPMGDIGQCALLPTERSWLR